MAELAQIAALEARRTRAWMERDRAALAALLHPDYLEINVFGRFSRREVLDELFPAHELLRYETDAARLLDLGDAACALSYAVSETLRSRGAGEQSFDCLATAVYLRGAAGWRLRLWQITPRADATA